MLARNSSSATARRWREVAGWEGCRCSAIWSGGREGDRGASNDAARGRGSTRERSRWSSDRARRSGLLSTVLPKRSRLIGEVPGETEESVVVVRSAAAFGALRRRKCVGVGVGWGWGVGQRGPCGAD